MKRTVHQKIEELFGIDSRSLSFFRIGLALLVLYDLIVRSTALTAHYTDFGILPRTALFEKFPDFAPLSFHFLNGSSFFQALLFLLTGLAAFSLLLGFRTRGSTLVTWILVLSLHNRNPMILQRGDILLRMFLFWALFLPLGSRFSVDRCLASDEQKTPARIFSAATVSLLLQICFVYWFTTALKSSAVWWQTGQAIEYALRIDQMVKPFGHFLLHFPQVLPLLTRGIFLWEIVGPLLAFIPVYNGFFRTLTVVAFLAFHLGLWLSLNLGIFPYVSALGWLVFLPSAFWDKLLPCFPRLGHLASRLTQTWKAWIRAHWIPSLKSGRLNFTLSKIGTLFVGLSLIYVLLWNVRTLNFDRYRSFFPPSLNGFGFLLRIDQMWDMFSPSPLREDGWFVIPGRLKDGREVDLFREGKSVSFEKPKKVSEDYPIERWQKYMMNIAQSNYSDHRPYFGRYLCRWWNANHPAPEQVSQFQIDFMMELTQADGQEASPQKLILWEQNCPQ